MELVKDRETKEPAADDAKKLVQLCYEKGLIILSCGNFGNVIRTLMPFSSRMTNLNGAWPYLKKASMSWNGHRGSECGKCLVTHFMLEKCLPGADPQGPDNHLMIATGSFRKATIYGSCRYGVLPDHP